MVSQSTQPTIPKPPKRPPIREYRAAVGLIASGWSMLERQIEGTIWDLAGLHPDLGICVTSQLQSARAKLIAVEGLVLVRTKSEDLAKQVRRFMNDIEGPTRKRNRIIHDPMTYWKGEGVFFVRTHLDRGVHRRIEVVELDDLKRFLKKSMS